MTSDEKTVEEMIGRLADIASALMEPDEDDRILSIGLVRGSGSDWFRIQCGKEAFGDGTTLREATEVALVQAEARLSKRAAEADALASKLRAATQPQAITPTARMGFSKPVFRTCDHSPQATVHSVKLDGVGVGEVERIVAEHVSYVVRNGAL